jgi:hypothetical protein
MRLTTKGRFAVTAMIDLAMRGERGPVALASISERQKISLSYLEQLFGKLRRHKLVDSVRGPVAATALPVRLNHGDRWPISFVPSMNNLMPPNAAAAKTVTTSIAA